MRFCVHGSIGIESMVDLRCEGLHAGQLTLRHLRIVLTPGFDLVDGLTFIILG